MSHLYIYIFFVLCNCIRELIAWFVLSCLVLLQVLIFFFNLKIKDLAFIIFYEQIENIYNHQVISKWRIF